MPKISVIVPTYNRVDLLPLAIGSILAQTYQDFEVIVVDDGSTDNTKTVVEAIPDRRVCYHYQSNQERYKFRISHIHLFLLDLISWP